MKSEIGLYLRYGLRILLVLAPLEFLLGRVIARLSRQAPAGETMAAVFGAIGEIGAFLVTPALLLAAGVLLSAAWLGRHAGAATTGEQGPGWPRLLGPMLISLPVFTALLLLVSPSVALVIAYNLVSAAVVLGIGFLASANRATPGAARVSLGLFTAAYACYFVFAIMGALAQAWGAPGLGSARVWVNAVGEAAAMAAAISLLWTAGPLSPALSGRPWSQRVHFGRLAVTLVPALIYLVSPLFEQWMQGVASQFSVGFTLFLPVPITALALAAYIYALLTCFSPAARPETGLHWAWELGAGLLLLPVAGYQLQLTYQHLMLAIVMLLMAGMARPFSRAAGRDRQAAPQGSARPAGVSPQPH